MRPACAELIKGILPTLALKIFLILVPVLLGLTSRYVVGHLSEARVDFDVGRKYFIFQFVVVFLVCKTRSSRIVRCVDCTLAASKCATTSTSADQPFSHNSSSSCPTRPTGLRTCRAQPDTVTRARAMQFTTIIGAASAGSSACPSDAPAGAPAKPSQFPILDLMKQFGSCPSHVIDVLGKSIPQSVRYRARSSFMGVSFKFLWTHGDKMVLAPVPHAVSTSLSGAWICCASALNTCLLAAELIPHAVSVVACECRSGYRCQPSRCAHPARAVYAYSGVGQQHV
jgi:Calcium-dependent channel, 7TM region, putative phosphate